MTFKYQFIHIGNTSPFLNRILNSFFRKIDDLGMKSDLINVINPINFIKEYQSNLPTYCLYFGDSSGDFKDIGILQTLINDDALILPIVPDINSFVKSVPNELAKINGIELTKSQEIEKLVGSVLEGLSLLRVSRRLFISYKRDESSRVAIQLFEQLEKAGFDVFLDTHSIRPGEEFQNELWHRLADTDIVVLLNTPNFLKSSWTTEELAKANSMSIGVVQLIWPTHKLEMEAELSLPIQLQDTDFGNKVFSDSGSFLSQEAIDNIVANVESFRARSLAARQTNIISEFMKSGRKLGIPIDLQHGKFITMKHPKENEVVVIPTVGVPHAYTYHQSQELVHSIKLSGASKIFLLFDHRYIREKWLAHLSWLDIHLPVKGIKLIEIDSWLNGK